MHGILIKQVTCVQILYQIFNNPAYFQDPLNESP